MTATRIRIAKRTARWSDEPVTAADAMDFWSFAAGAANVVMQLSNPGVGHGVVESKVDSGALMKHPWKRARTTFQYLAVAVIGSDEDRAAFRDAVDEVHRQVKSGPQSPVRYNAFDLDLQMWVAACLFVGLEDTYQLLRGDRSDRDRRRPVACLPGRAGCVRVLRRPPSDPGQHHSHEADPKHAQPHRVCGKQQAPMR